MDDHMPRGPYGSGNSKTKLDGTYPYPKNYRGMSTIFKELNGLHPQQKICALIQNHHYKEDMARKKKMDIIAAYKYLF